AGVDPEAAALGDRPGGARVADLPALFVADVVAEVAGRAVLVELGGDDLALMLHHPDLGLLARLQAADDALDDAVLEECFQGRAHASASAGASFRSRGFLSFRSGWAVAALQPVKARAHAAGRLSGEQPAGRFGPSAAEELPGDDDALNLRGPLVVLHDLRVAH